MIMRTLTAFMPQSPATGRPVRWCLGAAVLGAGGGSFKSIQRPLEHGSGAFIEAKQRAILVTAVTKSANRTITCAEPGPGALGAYDAKFAAQISETSADGGNYVADFKSSKAQRKREPRPGL